MSWRSERGGRDAGGRGEESGARLARRVGMVRVGALAERRQLGGGVAGRARVGTRTHAVAVTGLPRQRIAAVVYPVVLETMLRDALQSGPELIRASLALKRVEAPPRADVPFGSVVPREAVRAERGFVLAFLTSGVAAARSLT